MPISSKIEKIKEAILSFASLVEFSYKGIHFDVDPFNKSHFHLCCGDVEMDVGSIEEVLTTKFIRGKSIEEIADDVIIEDW